MATQTRTLLPNSPSLVGRGTQETTNQVISPTQPPTLPSFSAKAPRSRNHTNYLTFIFSIAIKPTPTSSLLKTPGPGSYNLQGSFDKFESIYTKPSEHSMLMASLGVSKTSLRNKSIDEHDEDVVLKRNSVVNSSLENLKEREFLNRTEIMLGSKREKINTSYCQSNNTASYKAAARQTLAALANNNPGPGAY